MNQIETIKNYILFLITERNLSVTLHPMESERVIGNSELMQFNIHDNPYCAAIKSSAEGKARCHLQQQRVFSHCCKTEKSFCGICHAGVFEYVYPIWSGARILGFISVGGYVGSQNGAVADCKPSKAYRTLKATIPDKKQIDTLLDPLCQMLELAYSREARENSDEDGLIQRICRYIRHNFATNVTVDELCREFSCSRSRFSHTFKRETGKSVPEYLIDVRISYAKHLLRYSAMNVTQIAFSTGFTDSNYFSVVFKRSTGVSPLAYRKNSRGKS